MRMRPQDWHAIAKRLGVRHTEPLGRPLLACLPAPIVAGGGCHVGMARELLHRHEVHPGRQEVAHEGPPEIVDHLIPG